MLDYFTPSLLLVCFALLALGYLALLAAYMRHMAENSGAVAELHMWRTRTEDYIHWLGEFKDITITLKNLRSDVQGQCLDVCTPPGPSGPWGVTGLRTVLRERLRARVMNFPRPIAVQKEAHHGATAD
jgi:hypothetical protein